MPILSLLLSVGTQIFDIRIGGGDANFFAIGVGGTKKFEALTRLSRPYQIVINEASLSANFDILLSLSLWHNHWKKTHPLWHTFGAQNNLQFVTK